MLDGKHSLADLLAQGLGMGEFNMDELLGLMSVLCFLYVLVIISKSKRLNYI